MGTRRGVTGGPTQVSAPPRPRGAGRWFPGLGPPAAWDLHVRPAAGGGADMGVSAMLFEDFLAKINEHSELELVYSDPTMCIIRYTGPEGGREIRLGVWAVRRMQWEHIVEAFHIPVRARAS